MKFLLCRKIIPVFSVPKTPATQASIEGSNAVFSRKFWNRHNFESIQEAEERLETFNDRTRAYLQYEAPKKEIPGARAPKVFFTRQVREGENGEAFARFGWEPVNLPRQWIDHFVLGEWDFAE